MCWAHVWTSTPQFQHEYFYSTRTPFSPSSISPHRRSSVSSTMWHQNWFHQEHTNTLTWLILTNRAKKWGQCAGFQKKIKNKGANVLGFFFGPGQLRRGHSVLLVIRATSVCHHLCGPVLEQRQRGLRASGATAHACSQAFSTSSHFCTYHIWAKLKASLTTATVNPFLSLLLWFQHKSIFSASHKRHLKHTLRQRSPFLQTL